jgi:hypothetical protein
VFIADAGRGGDAQDRSEGFARDGVAGPGDGRWRGDLSSPAKIEERLFASLGLAVAKPNLAFANQITTAGGAHAGGMRGERWNVAAFTGVVSLGVALQN